MSLTPDELNTLATARFGAHWPAKLATATGLSRAAISRWKKEGVASQGRAEQIRALLASTRTQPVRDIEMPSHAEFARWRQEKFGSLHAASKKLGIDTETLKAFEQGVTKNGNPAPLRPWIAYMMRGYDPSHGERRRNSGRWPTIAGFPRAEIIAAIKQGDTFVAIGRRFGVNPSTIQKAAAIEGISRRGPMKQDLASRRDAARAALAGGSTVAEAARVSGLGITTIEKYQLHGDLPRSARHRLKPIARDVDREAALIMIREGAMTYREIAARLGCSISRIAMFAAEAGIRRHGASKDNNEHPSSTIALNSQAPSRRNSAARKS